MKLNLISVGNDAKTSKGEKYGWLTGIMYLAPVNEAGFGNVCPNASKGCAAACLFTAGRGVFDSVKEARIRKTREFFTNKTGFMETLANDISSLVAYAAKKGKQACVRLNGTSDIPWERLGIMDKFPAVQFYDYTKSLSRALDFAKGALPKNYHLTFSRSEENEPDALKVLNSGGNVAAVFGGKTMPGNWNGFNVIDGDASDLRFLDAKNSVVGLKAKGLGRKDTTGFVVYA